MSVPLDQIKHPTFDMFGYAGLNSLIGRAINQFPINAAFRASVAQRQIAQSPPMANRARNSPSRSQYSEGYTSPFQYFAASNSWQTPAGRESRGRRASQPSTKFASPRTTIPTQVPWG
jgi:hypothetical protein